MAYYDPAAYQAAYGQTAYDQVPYAQSAYSHTFYTQAPSSTFGETATTKGNKQYPLYQQARGVSSRSRSTAASTVVLCTTIVFIIIVCALITVFAMGHGSSYVTETTETEAPFISLLRRGIIRVVPVLQTASTPASNVTTPAAATLATLQATTPGATEASSPSTTPTTTTPTTETPTASTASPAEVIDDQPLVCTMGRWINSTQMFPPDGLCEYLFYDSLYQAGRITSLDPSGFDTDLRTFVDIAPTYQITSFGVSFSYDAVFHLRSYLNLTVGKSKPLQHFWDRSVYHVGVLDTATVNPREADIIPVFECLKILRTLSLEIMAQGIKVFTFLAASIPDAAWASFYIRNFKNLFMPDLYIAIGHYSRGDNSLPSCRVVAPTQLQRPLGSEDSYQHDLTTAVESFVRLSSQPLKFALSVTMKGRVTVPGDPKNRGFLAPCKTNDTLLSFASYAEACNSPDYVSPPLYNSTVDAIQYRHVSEPTLLSYDDSRGLAKKLCTIKAQHTTAKFGIAVFDIDYADFANTCRSKGGPFSRLHLIRSVLNFFRTRYRTTADTKDCVDLGTGPSTP